MAEIDVDHAGRVVLPESKTLEYKRDLSSPDRMLESVVAFANSAGGQVVIGVADDGNVVGVTSPLVEEQRLTNLIADSIAPQLRPTIELVPARGQTLLVARVWLGQQRPYYLKKLGPHQGTYIRIGASDRQASAAMVAELQRSVSGVSFDQLAAVRATMNDIDKVLLSRLLGRVVDEQVMRTLRLIVEDQGTWVPTNGGVLIGCEHPDMFLPHAWVQCARFRGPRKRDIGDKANIRGPLPLAIDEVMAFFRRHAFLSSKFGENPRRQDVWSLPFDALRELVVNALVHSSFDDHGTPIKIAFRDEEIVIESPGGLVPGLTVGDMLAGTSVIRNPVLARVFEEMGHVEQWGSGIPEVMEDLAEAGLPPLEIEEGRERLRIAIRIPSHDPQRMGSGWERWQRAGDSDEQVSPQVEVQSPQVEVQSPQVEVQSPQVSPQVEVQSPQVSPQVEVQSPQVDDSHAQANPKLGPHAGAILATLANGSLGRAGVLRAIGLGNEYKSYQRHIVPLIEQGLVVMTNPQNPRAHSQTYTLTPRGRTLLASMADGDIRSQESRTAMTRI